MSNGTSFRHGAVRWRAYLITLTVALVSCVNVTVNPISGPTAAAPGWQVYQSADASLGISLPPSWKVITIGPDNESALRSAAPAPELQAQLRPVLAQLRDANVKFFAFDPTTPVENVDPRPFPAIASVSRRSPAPQSLDAFFSALPAEPAGRVVMDQKHVSGAVGDMVVRRVRETRLRPDRTFEVTVQYQCAVLRSGFLYILSMQVPDNVLSDYASTLDKIALSFAPF